jgi:Astacin (Peptidase family M12A)
VSERIAEAFWIAVLLVCVFSADQFLAAQPVSDEHKDPVSDEQKENNICSQQKKYHYLVNGERHYVPYSVIDGRDVVEGDIVIGDADGSSYFPPAVPAFVNLQATRWEGNEVPFVIDSSIDKIDSSKDKLYAAAIRRAIREWACSTNITFKELRGPRDPQKENYVKFVFGPDPAEKKERKCATNSRGIKEKKSDEPNDDRYKINIVWVGGCTPYLGEGDPSWGRVAHEIGHVLGLGHEQSRSDRGKNITVLWDNLEDKAQFCTGILVTRPDKAYDYDSIMHYSPLQDVKPPPGCQKVKYGEEMRCLSFFPKPEKAPLWPKSPKIGQRDHLSSGDIEAVNALYPARPPDPRPPTGQTCVITTTTTITVGGQTSEKTTTEPCPPVPDNQRCCHEKIVVPRPCYPDGCRRPVKVNWPRPDRWCRSEWCRPWPRPRPLCERDGWSEDRPPFDDWDE